jgi:uncharacterized membrane protein YdjX (TVP38/TMEM64 family)
MTTTELPTSEPNTDERTDPVDDSSPAAMEEGTAEAEDDGANNETADETTEEDEKPTDRYGCYKKSAVGLILLGLIVFVIVDSMTNQYVRGSIVEFLEWIENNIVAGVFSFMAVYFFATICFVPGSILTLGAGFVFSASIDSLWTGVLLGTIAVWIGASLGAIASFLLGRYLFRDGCVGRLTEKYTVFKALDNALMDKGLRIMILLRLSPIVPFNVLNYIAGATGVQFWHYTIACIAMLPGTILYVFLGASAGSLAEIGGDNEEEQESNKAVTISVIVVGVVFGILAIGLTSYYAKQELNKVIEAEKANSGDGDGDAENDEEAAEDEDISM